MSAQKPQTYGNHTRFVPMYHFVALPLLLINLVWAGWQLTGGLTAASLNTLGTAIALIIIALFARVNALKAQDRVIRLEERLRLRALLPAELAPRIDELTTSQLVGLRFAPDDEVVELVGKALEEQADQKTLKQAIKNWRPDYQRV